MILRLGVATSTVVLLLFAILLGAASDFYGYALVANGFQPSSDAVHRIWSPRRGLVCERPPVGSLRPLLQVSFLHLSHVLQLDSLPSTGYL